MTEQSPTRVLGRPSVGVTAALVVFGTVWPGVGRPSAEEGRTSILIVRKSQQEREGRAVPHGPSTGPA